MANIGGIYEADIKRFAKFSIEETRKLTRKVSIDLLADIIFRTPVDTGRARASWNIVNGASADMKVAPALPKVTLPPISARNAALTDGHEYIISNNLDYIQALENGHSKQAPSGMVRIAVASMQAKLNSGIF
jgi:hypothetical protein